MTNQEKKIKQIQEQIGDLAVELRDLAGEHADELMSQTLSTTKEYADLATGYAKETGEKIKKYAKENPQQAGGIAVAALAIIGLMIFFAVHRKRN